MSTGLKEFSVSLPLSITWTDFPDKESCAVIVYFSGCSHNCPGCQNPELQDSNYGEKVDYDKLRDMIFKEAKKAHTNKIVLSGGDPYFQPTLELNELVYGLIFNGFKVCIYTGADFESVYKKIPHATYYKCGKYDETQKENQWGKFSDKMVFVSKNQKLYDNKGKLISVNNVYYFNKWDTIKAKVKKFLNRVLNRESV